MKRLTLVFSLLLLVCYSFADMQHVTCEVYLTRNTNLPSEYQHDIWTSTKAVVFSPFSANYTIPVSKGALSIKNVLPDAELNYIIQNSTTGQAYVYTIALLNPEDKIVQLIPISITYK